MASKLVPAKQLGVMNQRKQPTRSHVTQNRECDLGANLLVMSAQMHGAKRLEIDGFLVGFTLSAARSELTGRRRIGGGSAARVGLKWPGQTTRSKTRAQIDFAAQARLVLVLLDALARRQLADQSGGCGTTGNER